MAKVRSPVCVGCGAPLGPWEEDGHVRCSFCQRDNFVQQQPVATPPRPAATPPRTASGQGQKSGGIAIVAIGGIVLLAAVGAGLALQSGPSGGGPFSVEGSNPGSGGVVPWGEHLQWGGAQKTVLPVAIDDDGVEDFIGIYRLLEDSTQRMQVGGFDGKTLERKWKTADLGPAAPHGYSMRLALAGRRVVITDTRFVAHVLEVTTGKEVGAVQLSDEPRRVCSEGSGGSHVWIQVADERHVLIDVTTAKATSETSRPSFCLASEGDDCDSASVPCLKGDAAPKTEAFRADTVLIDGDLGVALGYKTPGTPVPMLQGFDPKTKTARWLASVAPDTLSASTSNDAPIDLMGGRIYTTYEPENKGFSLVAFDARTGARTWDVSIPRTESGSDPQQVVVTPQRIYVPHWTWLDVFETAKGKYVGTVGIW